MVTELGVRSDDTTSNPLAIALPTQDIDHIRSQAKKSRSISVVGDEALLSIASGGKVAGKLNARWAYHYTPNTIRLLFRSHEEKTPDPIFLFAPQLEELNGREDLIIL